MDLKRKIMEAAWELFQEKGYTATTVNEIIEKAETSKGGFYYYFHAKDELLNSLYHFFDREYKKYYKSMDKSLNHIMQIKRLCTDPSSLKKSRPTFLIRKGIISS